MGDNEKSKASIIVLAAVILVAFTYLVLSNAGEKVSILYFRNDACAMVRGADASISAAKAKFDGMIEVTVLNASLYPTDPEDTEFVEELRRQYSVVGLPEVVINGEKMSSEITETNLFSEICNNFRMKPLVCL